MGRVKKILEKYKYLYKFLKVINYYIVNPLFSGYYLYMVYYFIFKFLFEKKKLISCGFKNIVTFKTRNWRIGLNKDHVYRRYFIAYYDNTKCFIKVAKNDLTSKNEINVQKKINNSFSKFSPIILKYDENFYENTTLYAIEYIENLQQMSIIKSLEQFDLVCSQVLNILVLLEKKELIHADFNKGNLMMCNDKVFLLDYGISKFKNENNNIDYVMRPGTFYFQDNSIRIYDDAYSFVKLVKSLNLDDFSKLSDSYKKIEERIGKFTFSVNIGDGNL